MGKDQEFLEAARNGNVVAVEKLLNSKAKRGGPLASLRRGPGSNVQDSSGYSALHHASLNGHREIVVLLLEHEASPNIVDSKGSSPLHLAAWAGHADIVRLLLTSGVRVTQINLKNKDNETALHCAAHYGHTGVVSLLLKYGADPSHRNVRHETALDLAAQYGRLETVELLLQTHPELIEIYKNQSRLEEARTLSVKPKTSPLHAASRNGHRAVVDALLAAGFPVSFLTQTGTALHEAALCGKVDVVRRLLDAGIDVSLKDSKGFSALRIVQDLPTLVVQEITNLIQNGALSSELSDGDLVSCSPGNGMPFRFPTSSFSPGSPYENVSLSSSGRGDNYERESRISASSCASTGADSFITLPRRRHKISSSSFHSQKSEGSNSVYEIPPPPRSLPWLQQQQQGNSHDIDGAREKRSSSQSDLLDDDSAFIANDDGLSRSYDERSLDFLSLSDNQSTVPDDAIDRSTFKRSSHARHSADQYLTMTAQPTTKISPNPPQKPPRKLQGMSAHYESLPRSAARQKQRQTSYYSVDTKIPNSVFVPVQTKRNPTIASTSGYELVYLARTGSRADASEAVPAPRFRVESTGTYVAMAGREPSAYENVVLHHSGVSVDDDSIYDIPRELGGSKAYENVSFNLADQTTTSLPAMSGSSSPNSTTPESPSRLPNMPPTPDHPPPPAHLAEQSIHLRIRPLSEEFKRKSRDMETETEEEIFLTFSNECDAAGSSSNGGSVSVSLSLSEKSLSADNMEEVVTSDQPYEGLLRGSVPGVKSYMDRPTSLATRGPSSTSSADRSSDATSVINEGASGGNRQNRTSLSVLSPFNEEEEWTKIVEMLNSCNSGLQSVSGGSGADDSHLLGAVQREFQNILDAMGGAPVEVKNEEVIEVPPIGNHGHDNVADWLLSLGFQHYLGLFIANGFDDIDFLGDGIVDDSSLLEIGVLDSEHRRQLVEASMLLKTPLHKMNSAGRPETVDEWLHLLRLDHYSEQFHKNRYDDMERVSRIWEVELTTVVEIRLVGHLRRILVSLGNGVQPHPAKLSNGSVAAPPTSNKPLESQDDLTAMSSDLKLISTSLARLEDEISQKMIETMGDSLVPHGVNEVSNKNTNNTLGRRKSRPAPQPPLDVKPVRQPVERLLGELAIRNPTDLVIGIAKTVATQWRHKPQHLLRPGVCYEAQYLGSTLVRHVRGTESTKRSIQKLKKKKAEEGGRRTTSIVLAISISGVQFLDPHNQETICKHEIRNINWACQDADDLTHFAYITKDHESTQDHFCHVFQVNSMDLATEVILTLGQAFEVAYQLVLRQEVYSPCKEDSSQPNVPALLNPPVQRCPSPLAVPVLSNSSATTAVTIPPAIEVTTAVAQPPTVAPAVTSIAATNNKPVAVGRYVVDPNRKIGPKPTVLPPKPKLGTALLQQRPGSQGISHARSHSSVDSMPVASGAASAMIETRLQSESNLASLQASNRPTNATMISHPSSTSVSSIGSGRAPLAAKDEL